jgi:hypothetical protein
MITTTITPLQRQKTASPRLAIKKEHLAGLDPEWVELWHTHGAEMVRADELPLEKYRENPSLYSFTYPTYAGECVIVVFAESMLTYRQVLRSFMQRKYRCLSQHRLVK